MSIGYELIWCEKQGITTDNHHTIQPMFEKILEQLKDIHGVRFYFLTMLVFLLTTAYLFKQPITDYIKVERFSTIEFRECRDLLGLEKEMDRISAAYPIIIKYGVYLYQPKDNASYKRIILTNSDRVKTIPELQGRYLKDQPSINAALASQPYYLIDEFEINQKEDLYLLKDLNVHNCVYIRLKAKGVIVGEIGMSFTKRPTPVELDIIMKELSPLLHTYIM